MKKTGKKTGRVKKNDYPDGDLQKKEKTALPARLAKGEGPLSGQEKRKKTDVRNAKLEKRP